MAILVIVIPVVAFVLTGFLVWRQFFETYHLAVVEDTKVYRDGNRGPRELFNALRQTQTKTVISLIDDQELSDSEKPEFAQEVELLKRQGIELIRVPVKLGAWPTAADIEKCLSVLSDKSRQPVLVHCAQGVRRTGMIVAAYQQSVLGWDDEKTKNAVLTFGHSERSIGDVKKFIDVYDPSKREMTEQLEQSKE
jgi:protein tyrosine phosphatase (PTP) superfamily phosphohydrolase (DUF442 family)